MTLRTQSFRWLTPWIFATVISLANAVPASAETVTLSSESITSTELPAVVAETLENLTKLPSEPHTLVLKGEFSPTSTIKIQWWGDHQLTVSGPALLDGTAMAEGSETLFMAGRNLAIENLRFTKSRGHAVIVGGNSENYAIRECQFEDCQRGAIHVWNDPHTISSTSSRRGTISGNRIARFNLEKAKWANDGITVFDQGVTISSNHITDSPTETNGIRAMGRDLIVEHNMVKGVSVEDSGGIYLWGGAHASLFRGNIVRWNHVIGASRGIYLDDGTSGALVEENVVENSAVCAIFLSGGRDNRVERNVVDGAPVFVHLDSRCLGWDSRPDYAGIAEESVNRLREALAEPAGADVLREQYPGLRNLGIDELTMKSYGRPISNVVSENFVRDIEHTWELMDFSTAIKTDFQADNQLADPERIGETEDLSQVSLQERFGFREWDRLEKVLSK